jgi:two-component sensor histidine kinase
MGINGDGMDRPVSIKVLARPESVATARRAFAAIDGLPAHRDSDLSLVISELVTNAIRHAGLGSDDEIEIVADFRGDGVRVTVRDGGRGFLRGTGSSEGGWGLEIVDELSDAWGLEKGAVWFEMS